MGLLQRLADEGHLLRVVGRLQRRYRRNGFKPGVDGETLERFSQELEGNLQEIQTLLLSDSYRFSPFMEMDISTWGGKVKTISRATLRDTIVQKALALVVEPALDSHLAPNCYSFRVSRHAPNINQAIDRIAECHRQRTHWVVKEDISSYFENIERERLLAQLGDLLPPSICSLYRRYLETPRAVNGRFFPRTRGLPVGTTLANFLSNLYLRPLDLEMKEHLYLRYCDDIIVFCRSEEEAQEAKGVIATTTANLGLSLNQEKSLLLPPGAPFVHLGYQFDKEAIKIGPRALAKFKARIRRATRRKRGKRVRCADLATEEGRATLREIIARVNSEITGHSLRNWVRYFARCDFDDQFRELDFWIRERVRATATKRWKKGNYRLLPTNTLQELGLKSLVGEYYKWKNAWRERNKSLISAIAKLDHLRAILDHYRRRYYHTKKGYTFRPGADGETMGGFLGQETTNLRHIQGLLLDGEYEFSPFIEYAKAKQGREDERVICRSSLADAIVQKAVAEVVEQRFDRVLSERCYSYRPGRSHYTAFGWALRYIREGEKYWVVNGDFQTFLDTVDLGIMAQGVEALLSSEPLLLDLYLKYLYNPRLREGKLLPRMVGLPRGGTLTPFLANLYLQPLDEALERFRYLRYADDIFIFAESRAQAEEAEEILREKARSLHLILRGRIFEPGEEFECLGYRVRGKEIAVRPYALNRLKRRIRRMTKRSNYRGGINTRTQEGREALRRLIERVNRVYIYPGGNDWARPFCRCTTDEQFRELDRWIADRIRACVTGDWSPRNKRLVPEALLRELGLKKLVPRFYHWKRCVWKQAKV